MNAVFLGLISLFFISSLCSKENIDYRSFSSISELIEYESSCILNGSVDFPEELSESYASRGESFVLKGLLWEALSDFQSSYIYGRQSKDLAIANQLIFRALFGQALVYGYLDELEVVESIAEVLL